MAEMKSLIEQRNDKIMQMEELINSVKTELRAMTDEECNRFKTLETEVENIDSTLEAEERARKIADRKSDAKKPEDERAKSAFDAYLRGDAAALREVRADEAQSTTLNANIIPSEFSNDIIRKVTELSGIFSAVTKVNSTGTYKQIVEKNKITAGWTAELNEVTKSTTDYSILEIGHHKLGALTKISFEIINQANFPIINEVMSQMVDAFTLKAEEGVIKGTGIGQPTGLMSGGTAFTLNSSEAITADELIKIYHELKAPYMPNAKWLMSRQTLCAVRLLKDSTGQYLFHEAELTSGYAGYILGKPILLSEIMGSFEIMYGDFGRAYKANVNPQMTIDILNELFSTQGAKGVLGYMYFDGKPVNEEAYIVAKGTQA